MISLFIMSKKGYEVLRYMVQHHRSLIRQVVSAHDPNVEKDFYEEIQLLAEEAGIPFFNRKDQYAPPKNYSIAISWRWIIPNIDKLIVIHDSILPKYRGFAPLVNSLKNGEKELGVTAFIAQEGYDTGPIIVTRSVSVSYPIKIAHAIDLVARCYVEAVAFICVQLSETGTLSAKSQKEDEATYCLWLDEDDYRINWSMDSVSIKRFIDAVGWPYAGAFSCIQEKKVRIFEASVVKDVKIENRTPGKVIFFQEGYPVVVCGEGLLKIESMTYDDGSMALPLKKLRTKFI